MFADLNRVRVRADGRVVAEHARVWARGTTVTDPAHVRIAAVLRKQFQQPRPAAGGGDADLVRDLADYDRAFTAHCEASLTQHCISDPLSIHHAVHRSANAAGQRG